MRWKAFAILNAALVLSTLFGPRAGTYYGPFAIVSIAISIPAAAGLLLYAFNKDPYAFDRDMPPRPFWMAFSWVFAAYSFGMLKLAIDNWVIQFARGKLSLLAIFGAFAVLAAWHFFTWLAVRRYAIKRHVLRLR
jgi:hypothetical protein